MSEEKAVWRTYCRDNDEVDPVFQVMNRGELKQARIEYRELRKLSLMDVIKQTRVPCNVENCWDFSEVITDIKVPGIGPEFQKLHNGGAGVTCLCRKHYDRLARDLSERILTLEERVDELAKEQERMYEVFVHRDEG